MSIRPRERFMSTDAAAHLPFMKSKHTWSSKRALGALYPSVVMPPVMSSARIFSALLVEHLHELDRVALAQGVAVHDGRHVAKQVLAAVGLRWGKNASRFWLA